MINNHRSFVERDLYSSNVADDTARIDLVDLDPEKLASACPNQPLVSVEIRCLSMLTICP